MRFITRTKLVCGYVYYGVWDTLYGEWCSMGGMNMTTKEEAENFARVWNMMESKPF